jgi:CRISPR-associated protein Csb2
MSGPPPSSGNLVLCATKHPTLARFALDGPVLPLLTDTLPLAEAVRSALLGCVKRIVLRQQPDIDILDVWSRCPGFYGKDAGGQPLKGHPHAFFLPTDDDGDGRLDHVTVFADQGFSDVEIQALDRLRQLYIGRAWPSERPEESSLRMLLVGLGNLRDFVSPLFAESRVWASATPFIATRYPKLRGTKRDRPEDYATPQVFAAHVLRQEINRRRWVREEGRRAIEEPDGPAGLPRGALGALAVHTKQSEEQSGPAGLQVVSIEPFDSIGPRGLRSIQFQRFRRKAGDDGGRRPGGAFRIVFQAPVRGPLCLGHSAHFGMGLFLPAE